MAEAAVDDPEMGIVLNPMMPMKAVGTLAV